ncbi:MAG: hypothetical protein MUE49_13360 [Rhodospirillales bacterium]|jgi:hypothetical protein|nr:hypothetical protein [Rhodospirillales bacterium]
MSMSRRDEARFLDGSERELVDQTRTAAVRQLSDDALAGLIRLVRERRQRARDIARRQRREMRGKSDPAGKAAARENAGSARKAEALSAALKRLNSEKARRTAAVSVPDQVRIAQKALRLRRMASPRQAPPSGGRTAGSGMSNIASKKAPSLTRPMEVGRVSQFVKAAQARKDSRGS